MNPEKEYTSHQILHPAEVIDRISLEAHNKILDISKAITENTYTILDFTEHLLAYACAIEVEVTNTHFKDYREVRIWFIKNLHLSLQGQFIDPYYRYAGRIEQIFKQYALLIDDLTKVRQYCTTAHDRFRYIQTVANIIERYLKFDYYFMLITKSPVDAITLSHEWIDSDSELEGEINKIQSQLNSEFNDQNSWQIIGK